MYVHKQMTFFIAGKVEVSIGRSQHRILTVSGWVVEDYYEYYDEYYYDVDDYHNDDDDNINIMKKSLGSFCVVHSIS